jgi:hypothetical protein
MALSAGINLFLFLTHSTSSDGEILWTTSWLSAGKIAVVLRLVKCATAAVSVGRPRTRPKRGRSGKWAASDGRLDAAEIRVSVALRWPVTTWPCGLWFLLPRHGSLPERRAANKNEIRRRKIKVKAKRTLRKEKLPPRQPQVERPRSTRGYHSDGVRSWREIVDIESLFRGFDHGHRSSSSSVVI